jgi:hypothetical protein
MSFNLSHTHKLLHLIRAADNLDYIRITPASFHLYDHLRNEKIRSKRVRIKRFHA